MVVFARQYTLRIGPLAGHLRMRLIGLMGAKGAGKDQFYKFAQKLYPADSIRRFAFADALRDEVEAAFLADIDLMLDTSKKDEPTDAFALYRCADTAFLEIMLSLYGDELDLKIPRSPRWIMTHWGTEYRQGIDRDYWLKWFGRAFRQALLDGIKLMICTDVRFHHEIRAIEILGGKLVAIRNKRAESNLGDNPHISEAIWYTHMHRVDIVNPWPNDQGGFYEAAVKQYLARVMKR